MVKRQKRCGFNPWVGKIPGEGNGNPLPYCLENPMDRGAWQAAIGRVRHNCSDLAQFYLHNKDFILVGLGPPKRCVEAPAATTECDFI